jgi:putative restriction endonuclease
MTEKELAVVEAFLCQGWSHRKIQKEILGIEAPERGGGYEAMKILHAYGITGEFKSILRNKPFNSEKFKKSGNIQKYLKNP